MAKFSPAYRTISSRHPPIDLFEDIADPDNWETLNELEMLTNPRIRNDIGDISLVLPQHRISGPGSTVVMAPFTHINPLGDRFTDGTYGAYYASDSFETSMREKIYHLEKHMAASKHFPDDMDQRVYLGEINGKFETINKRKTSLLNPNDYTASQKFAQKIRTEKDAIVYPSVRHDGHLNIAAFKPNVVSIPKQERHIQFHYDGNRITKYFDFSIEEWIEI